MSLLSDAAREVSDQLAGQMAGLKVERLVTGLFFTGVQLSGGWAGLCYTPIKEIPDAVCCPSSAGRIIDPRKAVGMPAAELLALLEDPEPLKAASALACLNALSQACRGQGQQPYQVVWDADALEMVDISLPKEVVVVGALVPALRRLAARGGPWWVLEQDPLVLKPHEREHLLMGPQIDQVLGRAAVLIITGVTILNRTLEPLLSKVSPSALVAVMGPTASMLPGPLFERGVDLLGGVSVEQAGPLLDLLAAGGSGYHFFGSLARRLVMLPPPKAVGQAQAP